LKLSLTLAASGLLMTGTALAQEAPATSPATPQQGSTAPATVSQTEVDQFALAALRVQQIAHDQAVTQEQKQAAMTAAVQKTGLPPQRFNQIAEATQSDEALNARVQAAAARHVQAAQATQ
jgi:hypothetical protein